MSEIWVLRHGQASIGTMSYDQLSPLGWEQCRVLGRYLAAAEPPFDVVFTGPRRRHVESTAAILEAFETTGKPEERALETLDEYPFLQLFRSARDVLYRLPETRGAIERFEQGRPRSSDYRVLLEGVGRFWARDELALPAGVESCGGFRARIGAALDEVRAIGRGRRALVSTSAGAVAAITASALGLASEAMIDLSFRVRNSSLTRLLFDEQRTSLLTFNELPHIDEARLVTFF